MYDIVETVEELIIALQKLPKDATFNYDMGDGILDQLIEVYYDKSENEVTFK